MELSTEGYPHDIDSISPHPMKSPWVKHLNHFSSPFSKVHNLKSQSFEAWILLMIPSVLDPETLGHWWLSYHLLSFFPETPWFQGFGQLVPRICDPKIPPAWPLQSTSTTLPLRSIFVARPKISSTPCSRHHSGPEVRHFWSRPGSPFLPPKKMAKDMGEM